MSIPNCPFCGGKMIIERVDIGGGSCPYTVIHEGKPCDKEFNGYFRTAEQADNFWKKAVYYAEER